MELNLFIITLKPEARASGFAIAVSISPQRFTHRSTRVCFCYRVKVAIDIRRGTHIAMSKPFLDLLHRHALCEEHRGAGVAKIVEENLHQLSLSLKPTVMLIICVIDN